MLWDCGKSGLTLRILATISQPLCYFRRHVADRFFAFYPPQQPHARAEHLSQPVDERGSLGKLAAIACALGLAASHIAISWLASLMNVT